MEHRLKMVALRARQRIRAERPFRDEFHEEMKPVLIALKVIGVLPVQRGRHRGLLHHRKLSRPMAYSVSLYLVVITGVFFVHRDELGELNRVNFDAKIRAMLNAMFDLLVVLLPLLAWAEAGGVAAYLSQWAGLQVQYARATGQPIRYATRREANAKTLGVVLVSALLEWVYSLQADGPFRYLEWFTSVYQDLLRGSMAVFWHLACSALANASGDLARSFRQEMSAGGAHRVAEYRLAWLRLSHLATGLGATACYTYGFYVSYLFLTLVLCVYYAVVNIEVVHRKSVSFVESLIIVWCLYLVCDGACRVANRVGVDWENLLLSAGKTDNLTSQLQIKEFLSACAHCPPSMSLGNYVTVDRSLLISLASAMATYLVVLVQFKMSDADQTAIQEDLYILNGGRWSEREDGSVEGDG